MYVNTNVVCVIIYFLFVRQSNDIWYNHWKSIYDKLRTDLPFSSRAIIVCGAFLDRCALAADVWDPLVTDMIFREAAEVITVIL